MAGPAVNVSPMPIPIHAQQEIVISGVGFPAGQEVVLETECPYGIATDITLMAGSPVTNERGTFVAKWELGRWATVNMAGSPGLYPLNARVGDTEALFQMEYKVLAPQVKVSPMIIPIDPDQEITIRGNGFPAEQVVVLETECPYGIATDITLMAGSPVTNERGAFVAKWELGRWATVNMAGSPGSYPLRVKAGVAEVLIPIVYEEN